MESIKIKVLPKLNELFYASYDIDVDEILCEGIFNTLSEDPNDTPHIEISVYSFAATCIVQDILSRGNLRYDAHDDTFIIHDTYESYSFCANVAKQAYRVAPKAVTNEWLEASSTLKS